jgi:hypothetical protein
LGCEAVAIGLTFEQLVAFGVVSMCIYSLCCALAKKPELIPFTVLYVSPNFQLSIIPLLT